MNGMIYTIVLSLLLSLAPVGVSAPAETQAPEPLDVRAELLALEDKDWMDLTNEQMLEDLDYLYQTLKDNYPFFGVAERKAGVNIDDNYKAYREQMKNATNDVEYWMVLTSFVSSVRGIGHLSPFDDGGFLNMRELYGNLYGTNPTFDYLKPWVDCLDNPVSEKNYALMTEAMQPLYDKLAKYQAEVSEYYGYSQGEYPPNVTTDIIEEGKIAYMNISSLDSMSQEEDKKVIFDFYEKVADYDHLIIDITNNGGGSTEYSRELIIAPNIDEPLSVKNYSLIMNGENNRKFFDFDFYLDNGIAQPVSELPPMEKMNAEDLKSLDYFMSDDVVIEPANSEKMFKGKIWLLTSGNVYSSAEALANFCKSTGFATLVGTRTGGDGIGTDPVLVAMPNSGVIVRYSSIYGVTADGANSEEFGTEPDIWQAEGQTALDACLEAIRQDE